MDHAQPPGRDTRWVGYSLDRHAWPGRPARAHVREAARQHGLTSPQVVYIQGKRFLFVGGLFASNFINVFRYPDNGELAIPSALVMQWGGGLYRSTLPWPPHWPQGPFVWRDANGDGHYDAEEFAANTPRVRPGPFWVDQKGNIWMAYGFFRYECQGLDAKGNPIYSADKVTVMEPPKGVSTVARVHYDVDTDTLVVADQVVDERGRAQHATHRESLRCLAIPRR